MKKVTLPIWFAGILFYILVVTVDYFFISLLAAVVPLSTNLLVAYILNGIVVLISSIIIVKLFGLIFILKEGTKLRILKFILPLVILLPIVMTHSLPLVPIFINFCAIYFPVRYLLTEQNN